MLKLKSLIGVALLSTTAMASANDAIIDSNNQFTIDGESHYQSFQTIYGECSRD